LQQMLASPDAIQVCQLSLFSLSLSLSLSLSKALVDCALICCNLF
jgi:hypothetical protein